MADYDAYKIESDSQLTDTTIYFADSIRIIPLEKEGLVKNEPKAKDFSTALKMLLPEGLEDAGLADNDKSLREKVLAKTPDIYASFYIDPEEALFLLTGTRPSLAAYRFKWKGRVYFTMRPDYGLHYILSTVECEPINCFESEIRNRLLGLKKEINSIEQAIRHRDIIKELRKGPISQVLESGGFYHFRDTEAPFDEWTQLFQKRGFDLSHIPQKYLNDPLSVLKKENSLLKANLEQTEKKNHELSAQLQQCEKRLSLADDGCLASRSKRTYLNIIGAFLEVTTGTLKDMNFSNESELREFIAEKFDDLRGVSTRNLADKFALAKKALKGQLD